MPGAMPAGFVASQKSGQGGQGGRAALQDLFLAAAAREQEAMTVFLINGVMLQGVVAGYDQFSLLLERGGQVQLIYKHAISTLQPAHSLDLEPEQGGSAEEPAAQAAAEPSAESEAE